MPIKLRVVGILYNNIVNLPGGGGTVQQVLDAAVKSPGPLASGFGYIPIGAPGKISVNAFKAAYPNPIKSVTSGKIYDAGIYFLRESSSGQFPSIWQYYIYDSEGRVVGPNKNVHVDPTNPGGGTINYFGSASAFVPDGGSLVWRLVAIPTGPGVPLPIDMSRMIHTQMSDETA